MIHCGHAIDNYGLRKSQDKVKSILKAPQPQSVLQWNSFLKMVSCYYRVLPNIETAFYPLMELLHKRMKCDPSACARDSAKTQMLSEVVYVISVHLCLHCGIFP